MDEVILPDSQDQIREYPAARCRGCGVITHVCTFGGEVRPRVCRRVKDRDREFHLDEGWKLENASHRKHCTKPPSRAVLLAMLQNQAPELESSDLERYMTEDEVKQAADELIEYLRSRDD